MILYWACLLTVIIETSFFCFLGYRNRDFHTACVAVNIITNLTLNLTLSKAVFLRSTLVYIILEIVIVMIEFTVYCIIEKPSVKLFLHTLCANIMSLTFGGALFRIIRL